MKLKNLLLSSGRTPQRKERTLGVMDLVLVFIRVDKGFKSIKKGARKYFMIGENFVGKWAWFNTNYSEGKGLINPIQDLMMMAGIGGGAIVVWKIIEGQLSIYSVWVIVVLIIAWYVGFYTLGFVSIKIGLREKMAEIGSRILSPPLRRIEDKIDKLLPKENGTKFEGLYQDKKSK